MPTCRWVGDPRTKHRTTNRVAETPTAYSLPGRQLSLFGTMPGRNGNGLNGFRDPAFADNKSLPIHRWVPWIAGYSATFVDDAISMYVRRGSAATILDPFCGVGTTLLQATLRGHEAIGFEINPYAALAARAKLNAPQDREKALMDWASRPERCCIADCANTPNPLNKRPTSGSVISDADTWSLTTFGFRWANRCLSPYSPRYGT